MRVCVTGATGCIGRALIPVLHREGHTVVVWVRSEARARSLLGAEVETVAVGSGLDALTRVLERSDAVINLAGEPVVSRRWTAARRAVLRSSRVDTTRLLVQAIAAAAQRPGVLISGSAVGYYGDRGDERLTEASAPGDGFLSELCQEWEAAAREAERLGVRVMTLRTGVVLGRDGGALAQMLPPFRLGAGGPIGSGRQYLPWIHLHDLVRVLSVALVDDRYRGPLNGVAPAAATSREFGKSLGRALHRPAILPTPAIALRVIFGEAASVLLGSQRVEPSALQTLGFAFEFPALDGALADILGGSTVSIGRVVWPLVRPQASDLQQYLVAHRPQYELRTTTLVNASVDDTFAFFSKAGNLGMMTPAAMKFAIEGTTPVMGRGATINYRLSIGPVPIRWRTLISGWEPGRRFADLQEAGPYRAWWHEHSFRAEGRHTVMEDRVYYSPPFGVVGRIVNRLFIGPALRKVFQYRGDVIRMRFGVSG